MKSYLAALVIGLLLSNSALGQINIDEDIKDYGIHEFILPAIERSYHWMPSDEQYNLAKCQVRILEKLLQTQSDVIQAMMELPLYIDWSEGITSEEPEIIHEEAILNAYMQCNR